jgi:hypothetical protein
MEFDIEAYLADSPFTNVVRHLRGQPQLPGSSKLWLSSGFNVTVSEADMDDLAAQIDDAIAFLDEHEDELRRLGRFEGVDGIELDFAVAWRDLATQSDWLPPELLWRAGALDIALRVTHYLTQERES